MHNTTFTIVGTPVASGQQQASDGTMAKTQSSFDYIVEHLTIDHFNYTMQMSW